MFKVGSLKDDPKTPPLQLAEARDECELERVGLQCLEALLLSPPESW